MRPQYPSRRALLGSSAAAAVAGLGGCVFNSGSPDPAALQVVNRGAERRTVTVTASRTSDDASDVRHANQTPRPAMTPLWSHEDSFTVDGEGTLVEPDFFPEPGAYYVVARLDDGRRDAGWIRIGEAVDGGIADGYAHVRIAEDGDVVVRQRIQVCDLPRALGSTRDWRIPLVSSRRAPAAHHRPSEQATRRSHRRRARRARRCRARTPPPAAR